LHALENHCQQTIDSGLATKPPKTLHHRRLMLFGRGGVAEEEIGLR